MSGRHLRVETAYVPNVEELHVDISCESNQPSPVALLCPWSGDERRYGVGETKACYAATSSWVQSPAQPFETH